MIKHLWKSQEGAVAVIVGLLLTVMLGFVGLALDIGNLVVYKTRMQNAVDAAVCGGGLKLPNQSQAQTQAQALLTSNGFNPATATITFTADTVHNPSPSAPEINCTLTQNVSTYFMGLFGFKTVPVTASAEAILQAGQGGPFSYALFSGTSLSLIGNTTVHGSVHANGSVTLTGNINVNEPGIINGNVEGATGVSATGNITVDGALSANSLANISTTGNVTYGSENASATNITMPDYSSQLNTILPSMTTYDSNMSWNGNIPALTNSVYVNGTASLTGNINTTGAIVATGDINISGNVTLGSNNQICLYSLNGNVNITGNVSYGSGSSAVILAPNGTVTYTGNSSFTGIIVAKSLNVTGNATYNAVTSITALPVASNTHVKLIN